MHKCRIYGPDKLNLWPIYHLTFKCDLDLQPTWTNVSDCISTPIGELLCQIILKFMHECRSFSLDKLNLWPFYHLTFKCDLDLQSTWTNVLNCIFTPQGEQLCQINFKSMHKCRSGLDKLNLWPFHHLILKCDLDLQPTGTWTNISYGTSTPQGKQLCHIILKFCTNVQVMVRTNPDWRRHNTCTYTKLKL